MLSTAGREFVFSDRHAYLQTAQFFTSIGDLDEIDWGILQRRDFQKDVNDLEKTDRYQAEALVFRHLPAEHLAGIVCMNENKQRTIEGQREEVGLTMKIVARPNWYFR